MRSPIETAAWQISDCSLLHFLFQLYAEIAQWKTEIKQLAEEITDRDEELEELRRDNSEIRDTMLRKQNRLRETDEAVQNLVREKKESVALIERCEMRPSSR